jgi:hypothetical protein
MVFERLITMTNKNTFFYATLAILAIVDAWLLAHPNLIGRLGILMYNYNTIKTLPRAFGTVTFTVAFALIVSYLAQFKIKGIVGLVILGICLLASTYLLIDTYFKFSTGTYAMTGAGFKTGAMLMPLILILIFAKSLYEKIRS